jgi:hypothetical protein
MIEGLQQWPLLLVIVVRMGLNQRSNLRRRGVAGEQQT